MNKKAILIGQVFAFIIAGIIFVLILVFGYGAISDMLKSSSDISIVELKSDLESSMDNIKRSFGSVRKLELRVPKGVEELCFFDYNECENLIDAESSNLIDAESSKGKSLSWAVNACKSGSANVFTVPRIVDVSIEDLVVKDSFVCIPNQGGIVNVKLIGRGNAVEVDVWG